MRSGDAVQVGGFDEPQRNTLQSMPPTKDASDLECAGLGLCTADGGGGTAALYESQKQQLSELRSAGDRVPFSIRQSDGRMGLGEPWAETEGKIYRSNKQRRPLRTGQFALGHPERIEHKQTPTWDIIDCGPRNRFMANGRIVHNSGEWRINLQNLPRDISKSKLRSTLIAPFGHCIISADLSQIEARLVAWLAGCPSLLKQFATGQDPYALLAQRIFGYQLTKSSHPIERFIGKTGILGLGYGCGVDRFFAMVLSQARQAGLELGSMFTYTTADRTVDIYRNTYWEIPDLWRQLDRWLPTLNYGPEHAALGPRAWREDFHEGQWVTRRYDKTNLLVIKKGAIVLPNAMELRYNVPDTKIYGAKLLENIIQALARIVVMQAALRLSERGQRFCLQVHDELVFIVPTEEVDTVKEIILAEMIRQPTWAPGLPLAAEVGVGKSYGDCKT
jgi:DNA polymerase